VTVLGVLIRKEWEDVFRNRMVLLTLLLTPALLVVVAVGTSLPVSGAKIEPGDVAELRTVAGGLCDGVADALCLDLYLATLMMGMFLVLPTVLPSVIAAYSIVGEKTERTLEPLLATPITTTQLLAAKALAAVVPAVVATWTAAGAYLALLAAVVSPALVVAVLSPAWIAALLGIVPLLALASVLVAVMVSSRSTDPRSAQQVAGLVVAPVIGLLIAQSLGVMVIRPSVVGLGLGILMALDGVLGWLAVQLFQRESVLTRWSGL
jgi:ABC-2 type transport system permease protein